jgi:hypothetical protein
MLPYPPPGSDPSSRAASPGPSRPSSPTGTMGTGVRSVTLLNPETGSVPERVEFAADRGLRHGKGVLPRTFLSVTLTLSTPAKAPGTKEPSKVHKFFRKLFGMTSPKLKDLKATLTPLYEGDTKTLNNLLFEIEDLNLSPDNLQAIKNVLMNTAPKAGAYSPKQLKNLQSLAVRSLCITHEQIQDEAKKLENFSRLFGLEAGLFLYQEDELTGAAHKYLKNNPPQFTEPRRVTPEMFQYIYNFHSRDGEALVDALKQAIEIESMEPNAKAKMTQQIYQEMGNR